MTEEEGGRRGEVSQGCFLLALTGTPFDEIATVQKLPVSEVHLMVEQEVWSRTKHQFDSLDDALNYLRLGRIQRGLWTSATSGGVSEARQVMDLVEQREQMKHGSETLTSSVRHMLNANNIIMTEPEEQDDE